ncbi:hypothetical protein HDK77DRAFT_317322 [Phyllosticta capitalensis]
MLIPIPTPQRKAVLFAPFAPSVPARACAEAGAAIHKMKMAVAMPMRQIVRAEGSESSVEEVEVEVERFSWLLRFSCGECCSGMAGAEAVSASAGVVNSSEILRASWFSMPKLPKKSTAMCEVARGTGGSTGELLRRVDMGAVGIDSRRAVGDGTGVVRFESDTGANVTDSCYFR